MALLPFAKTILACWRTLVPPCMFSRVGEDAFVIHIFSLADSMFSCFPGWEKPLLLFIKHFVAPPIPFPMFPRMVEGAFVIHNCFVAPSISFFFVFSRVGEGASAIHKTILI